MLIEALREMMSEYIVAQSIVENKEIKKEQLNRLSYDEILTVYHSVRNFSKRI